MTVELPQSPAVLVVGTGDPVAVVLRFHHAIDSGAATRGLPLFTGDAVFQAAGRAMTGRRDIEKFLVEREKQTDRHTAHVLVNWTQDADETGDVEVRGLILLFVRAASGTYALERVLDTVHALRRNDDGWLIFRRLSRPLHPSPAT